MPLEVESIPKKILYKIKKLIKKLPTMDMHILDILDSYEIQKNSPHISNEKLYRVSLACLPNDKLVNKFAIKMRGFDISTGFHNLAIKEIPLSKMKRWSNYKVIERHLRDFKPYEEVAGLDIREFVKFCKEYEITERQIWYTLLDDTFSKSEEIIYTFYPTIIPIPRNNVEFQKYNSHCLLFTQSKTGKSETCYRLYPQENYENISLATLLGTADKDKITVGALDGQGLFFIDEINKLKDFRGNDDTHGKTLDYINTYLEKGIERRGVWGKKLEVKGTKTIIFSGNVNIINAGEKDFYHLMSKICTFSNDADKFGRRLGFFIYDPKLKHVKTDLGIDPKIIEIFNSFRYEILKEPKVKKRILDIFHQSLEWVNEDDREHKKNLRKYMSEVKSPAIQALINGKILSSHHKLKFMAVRITIANHIFEIIESKAKKLEFIETHQDEIEELYEDLKELLSYKQIENLHKQSMKHKNKLTNLEKVEKYIEKNNIDVFNIIKSDTKDDICEKFNLTRKSVDNKISIIRKRKSRIPSEESDSYESPSTEHPED